jgi:hypothetical protein
VLPVFRAGRLNWRRHLPRSSIVSGGSWHPPGRPDEALGVPASGDNLRSELEPLFDKLARAASRRGRPVHPGMDLASTQHAIGKTALWHARVLAGWVPPAEIEPMVGGERRLDFVPAAHARLTVGGRTILGVRRPADPRLELPPERGLVPAYAGSQAPTVQRPRGRTIDPQPAVPGGQWRGDYHDQRRRRVGEIGRRSRLAGHGVDIRTFCAHRGLCSRRGRSCSPRAEGRTSPGPAP